MRPQLTSVGSYNVDYYIVVDRLPVPGETIRAKEFYLGHGGKGSNQAVSAARLGASARLIAAVGNDEEGRKALEFLSSEGVDTSGVSVKPSRTGRAYILVSRGQNMIVVDPGANSMLSEEDVLRSLPRGGALTASLEVPLSAVRAALESFSGVKVFNPAPAAPEARELARLADVITPNEVEALQLTGASTPAEAAERLLELAPAVIITLGERGAMVAERGRDKAIIEAPKVDAVDPTGAGDAFNAALAYSLACGLDLVGAASVAVRAASYKVTRKGALGLRASELLSLGLELPCSR